MYLCFVRKNSKFFAPSTRINFCSLRGEIIPVENICFRGNLGILCYLIKIITIIFKSTIQCHLCFEKPISFPLVVGNL